MTEIEVDVRVGSAPRRLRFKDGASFETDDHEGMEQWLALSHRQPWWERVERYLPAAIAALLLSVAFYWVAVFYGLPALAGYVAEQAPPAWDASLGEQAWEGMDEHFFKPTALSEAEQQSVRQGFEQLRAVTPDAAGYRLFLRRSDALGANAITFPGGRIVVTDQLVKVAQNPDEISAVLAHEFGHAHYRHGLRTVLEHTALGLIVVAVSGDISVIGGSLPIILVKSNYSRRFETDADRYAVDLLQRLGIAATRLADALDHIQQSACAKQGPLCEPPGWLSTHPLTAERTAWLRNPGDR